MVVVNCASLDAETADAKLFGVEVNGQAAPNRPIGIGT